MESDAPNKADSDVEAEIAKKGRGRAAVTKKRGAANKKSEAGQKLITETSPEQKVRRMRPSPFNKKSGSVLNKGESSDNSIENADVSAFSLDSINEALPSRPRPQRANKKQITYVLSDSESDQPSSDSFSDAADDISDDDDSDAE